MATKKLIKYYGDIAEKELKQVQVAQKDLQRICDEFGKVTKGKKPLTIEELKSMFSPSYGQPKADEEVIRDLIIDRYITGKEFGGLQIRRDAFETPPIDEIVKAIKSTIKEATIYLGKGYFEIESGTVKVRDWVENTIVEENKTYAETPDELQRLELAQRLADVLNEIQDLLPENPFLKTRLNFDGDSEAIVEFDNEGRYLPTDFWVKTGKATPIGALSFAAPEPKETEPDNKDYDNYIETLLANN